MSKNGEAFDKQWGGLGIIDPDSGRGYLVTPPDLLFKFRKKLRLTPIDCLFLQYVRHCINVRLTPYAEGADLTKGQLTRILERLVRLNLIDDLSELVGQGEYEGARWVPKYGLTKTYQKLAQLQKEAPTEPIHETKEIGQSPAQPEPSTIPEASPVPAAIPAKASVSIREKYGPATLQDDPGMQQQLAEVL